MPARVYQLTVVCGALAWMVFGMYLSMILQPDEASKPLEVILAGLFFVMAVMDSWWLLRFGSVRAVRPPEPAHLVAAEP